MKRKNSLLATIVSISMASAIYAVVPPTNPPPTFSASQTFTNQFFPFQTNAVKVYQGKSGKSKEVVVDLYTTDTRSFIFNLGLVTCRVLQEMSFDDGQLVEISRNFFAQSDNGSVYYFGEIVDIYENGVITNHEGSWLVGGATLPSDPPGTGNASAPTLFMPANPELNDTFKQEDIAPIADETDMVIGVGLSVKVPAGQYANAIEILESTSLDSTTEKKWYAPGVGVIKSMAKGEKLQLISSTLRSP
ncbi:MAG: hypothetical protein HY298_04355 [Verrucomicrobia bacterium]|nr:hypothetical protein [Verrucomicrobiota bacterium]